MCKEAAEKSNHISSAKAKETVGKLLKSYLNAECSLDEYESMLRQQLGANSYVAFTLDWLVERVCKQMQAVESSDTIDLYTYVQRQGCFPEEVYFALMKMMLPDEHWFRIEMLNRGESLTTISLNVHYIHKDCLQEPLNREVREGIEDLGDEPFGRINMCTAHMFLGRVRVNPASKQTDLEDDTPQGKYPSLRREERLKMMHISNGMECEIDPQTHKVSSK